MWTRFEAKSQFFQHSDWYTIPRGISQKLFILYISGPPQKNEVLCSDLYSWQQIVPVQDVCLKNSHLQFKKQFIHGKPSQEKSKYKIIDIKYEGNYS